MFPINTDRFVRFLFPLCVSSVRSVRSSLLSFSFVPPFFEFSSFPFFLWFAPLSALSLSLSLPHSLPSFASYIPLLLRPAAQAFWSVRNRLLQLFSPWSPYSSPHLCRVCIHVRHMCEHTGDLVPLCSKLFRALVCSRLFTGAYSRTM